MKRTAEVTTKRNMTVRTGILGPTDGHLGGTRSRSRRRQRPRRQPVPV